MKIYIDEDAMGSDLVAALRSRGITVITPSEVNRVGKTDDEQLAFAAGEGCILYTYNVSDFFRIHNEWLEAGREHGGIILVHQQRFTVGEQLRRILRLRSAFTAKSMRNEVEFLSNWN